MVVGAVKSLGDGEEVMEERLADNIWNTNPQEKGGGYQGVCLHLWR
jgi:hypothetical protein